MKKGKFFAVPVVAIAIIIAGRFAIGDAPKAEYIGSNTCKMCHRLMNKELVEAYETTGHPKALQQPDAEGAIVANFESNSVFSRDDVAYVLGKGRNEQAYLDADLKLLPAKWDVKSKTWKPRESVDGATQCIGCHVVNYEPETKTYAEAGVTCESCHGPGSAHRTGAKEGILNPKNLDRAQRDMVCGQCHSKGTDKSGEFAHPVAFRPGEDLTKRFTDAKPTSPGQNQQYSEHITSKHAEANIGCMDCHDPHNVALHTTAAKPEGSMPVMLRKPINDLCMGCHADTVKDMATHAPNAAEGANCASCHMPNGQHTFGKAVE